MPERKQKNDYQRVMEIWDGLPYTGDIPGVRIVVPFYMSSEGYFGPLIQLVFEKEVIGGVIVGWKRPGQHDLDRHR